ncbi:MAG: AAA family ATPase, partial [Firmicutes bacterium]|nr:AAA family ATPase [Bacillota bacterium]
MIVTHLRLRRFKKFDDWAVSLAPGLNVIRGGNEAGKTTLMDAIFEGLCGDPARDQATAHLRSWGEQRLGEITMELDVGGARYLLRKDLEAGTILLQSADGRERLESARDVQRRLQEWTGLGTEAALRATAFVGQGDLARVTEDRRWLSGHLSRALSGAGVESVQQSLQRLAEQRARLTSAGVGVKGLQDRIADLRGQLASLRQRQERALRHRIQLRQIVRRLEDVEAEMERQRELVRSAQAAADLRRREQALLEEEAAVRERLTRAEGLEARLAQLEGELSEFSSQQETLI